MIFKTYAFNKISKFLAFKLEFKDLPLKIDNKTLIQNSVGCVHEVRVGGGRNELSTLLKALS